MFYVYLLQSKIDKTYYIGITTDLERRLAEHNSGKVYYTKRKMPWIIYYYETYQDESVAQDRERKLKKHGSSYYGLMKRLGLK